MAYNSTIHTTTGFTPYKLRFGEEMRMPFNVLTDNPEACPFSAPLQSKAEHQIYLDQFKAKMRKIYQIALETTNKQVQQYKDCYDVGLSERQLEVGQKVWVYKPHRKVGVCPKLQSKWEKNYRVRERLSDVLYRVQKDAGKTEIIHIQRLLPYLGSD